ncbi:hypothetical protein [Brevibacillus dissolubilis]|uniref:hypothetical protein n=1 Tax=Brevibacillus dissolubilis TaxID=1844116 RepID=UPI00111638D2|nr:hypothetical protein [Brevibacillus dissolubilis]
MSFPALLFRANAIRSGSTYGESTEKVFTTVTIEIYNKEQFASSVTKENLTLIKQIGRMHKVIDAGEEKNLSDIASKQLTELSKIPWTRSVTVVHNDPKAGNTR